MYTHFLHIYVCIIYVYMHICVHMYIYMCISVDVHTHKHSYTCMHERTKSGELPQWLRTFTALSKDPGLAPCRWDLQPIP